MELAGTAYHPDFGGYVHYRATPLSTDPDTQVAQTIQPMKAQVREDSSSPVILEDAAQVDAMSPGDPCAGAFWWVKGPVRFQPDAQTAAPIRPLLDDEAVEVLIRPRDLARMNTPVEDCDGFASYTAAILRALGVPCSFVTVAADPRDPSRYSHVYLACYPNGERIALDTSHGAYPGWECEDRYGKKREWSIDGFEVSDAVVIGLMLAGAWIVGRWIGAW